MLWNRGKLPESSRELFEGIGTKIEKALSEFKGYGAFVKLSTRRYGVCISKFPFSPKDAVDKLQRTSEILSNLLKKAESKDSNNLLTLMRK